MMQDIVILGSGESGVGAALLAKKQGLSVFVSEKGLIAAAYKKELLDAAITFEEGGHTASKILSAGEVIKSPGIPDSSEMVRLIRNENIAIISEVEFAFRYASNSKIIAITGSNGKTTTSSLIFHLCNKEGLDCALVGNIGVSFARQVATNPKAIYVIEISSFQLDDIVTFRPHIAVLTNITEDHLDRYNYKMENYINSKFKIIMNQTKDDYFIFSVDDKETMSHIEQHQILSNQLPISMNKENLNGAFIKDGDMYVRTGENYMVMHVDDFLLKGKHNQYNTMAACVATVKMGVRKEKLRDYLEDFQSLEHRLEPVLTIRGIHFINDSKATNINSVWYALESINTPIVLIMGGVDKGNDYTIIEELVKEKVKAIICLGNQNEKIFTAFEKVAPNMQTASSAEQAVQMAYGFSAKGDTVLLSPGCASFDLFKNYEDRGNQFKQAIRNL